MEKVRRESILESFPLDVVGEIPTNNGSAYLDEGIHLLEYREAYGSLAAVFCYLTEKEKNRSLQSLPASRVRESQLWINL